MKHRDRFRLGASFLFVYFVSLGFISSLWAQEPFYKGKTIRIIVGFTPGGINDRWARFYAKYLPKHIAGGPEFIIQHMPGAGSRIAANYVYSVAKPDGLTLIGSIVPLFTLISLWGGKRSSTTRRSSFG